MRCVASGLANRPTDGGQALPPDARPLPDPATALTMGHNRRFRKLNDAVRYQADIVITCSNRRCGHEIAIDLETLSAIRREFRVNDDLEILGRALRCHRCSRRWPLISMTMKGDERTLALKDGDALPPKGIALSIWLKAHGDGRKRLRRLAR